MCKSCNQDNCCCPKTYRGPKGDQGDRGRTGPIGPTGPAGAGGDWFAVSIYSPATTDYKAATSASYVSVARVQFPGATNTQGTLTEVLANFWNIAGVGTSDCRIYDVTNSLVIAEITGVANNSQYNVSSLTITPANISNASAVWLVQILGKSGGVPVETGIASVSFRFV